MNGYPPHSAHTERSLKRKAGRPWAVVGVASHRDHRSDCLELDQDREATDVACMNDEVDSIEKLRYAGVEQTMRVRDHADGCLKTGVHAYSPRAFLSAGTRLRDTGT